MDKLTSSLVMGDIIAALVGIASWFRGEKSPAVESGETDGKQKMVSSLKAAFSKEDEGIWVSLMAALEVPEQDAITLVLKQLTGVDEVDSFRLSIVNAPNATHTEETRDPAKPKVVIKKVMHVPEFSKEDNRIKLLKNIAARETNAAVEFVRVHHLAVENSVTKYGPALLDQLSVKISAHKQDGWLDMLRRVPIALWIIGGGTVLLIIATAIKIHFID